MMEIILILLLSCFLAQGTAERKLPYKIKGPKSFHDNIAIVGAGASGVHMAYLLKQKGFHNVHILEKSSRIGGKVYTVHHRNVAMNMGAVEIEESFTHVWKLVKTFLPNELVKFPRRTVWFDNKIMDETEFATYYIKNVLGGIYSNMDDESILAEYAKVAERYNKLSEQIFGKYEGGIAPKPKNMELIKGTFHDFLVRNNFTILIPSILVGFTSYGYSYMKLYAAFYNLIWKYTPPFPMDHSKVIVYTLKSGYQKLFEEIVEKENLHVTFNVDIQKVYRKYGGDHPKVWLYMAKGNNHAKWEYFDFLIWTPEMQTSMDSWVNKIQQEKKLLGRTIPTHYTISIVDSKHEQHGVYPLSIFADNLKISADGKVHAFGDTYATFHNYTGPKYLSSQYPMGYDGKHVTTYVTYQQSIPKRPHKEMKKLLTNHFKKMSASSVKVVYSKTWRYFPRHSVDDIDNGVIWEIIDMQGKYGMWYVGSTVYFETVHHVTTYNAFIVENMEMPTD